MARYAVVVLFLLALLSSEAAACPKECDRPGDEYLHSPQGSATKAEARKMLVEDMSHTMLVEDRITLIGNLLFGIEKGPEVLKTSRPAGLPFVDDCFLSLDKIFTKHCGSLRCVPDGFKSIAKMCNAGIKEEQFTRAARQACPSGPSTSWNAF